MLKLFHAYSYLITYEFQPMYKNTDSTVIRHLGRDSHDAIRHNALWVNANLFQTDLCRDPGSKDGGYCINKYLQLFRSYIPIHWIPAISAGMTWVPVYCIWLKLMGNQETLCAFKRFVHETIE